MLSNDCLRQKVYNKPFGNLKTLENVYGDFRNRAEKCVEQG